MRRAVAFEDLIIYTGETLDVQKRRGEKSQKTKNKFCNYYNFLAHKAITPIKICLCGGETNRESPHHARDFLFE